jgi:aspartyl-tRNA(Asn)/glutamyl-tRNA(Gln) amidotransferase subunit C
MEIDDQMIDKISGLAYLAFGAAEKEKIRMDLEQILTFVEKLKELDTENVEPLVYLSDKTDVLREDKKITTLGTEEALRNAPERSGPHFKVPSVIRKSQSR